MPDLETALTCLNGLLYIVASGILINFNKYLVHAGRFPHPMVLTTLHMLGMTVCTNVLYTAAPSMFPAMGSMRGKYLLAAKCFIPIGLCFAVNLYGANAAYLFCSVAFLQFMKEGNVAVVFALSCIVGLQQLTRTRLLLITWVVLGAFLCVQGDMAFSAAGFFLQLISQLSECARIILAEFVLNGNALKLDPMTYTRFIAPVCVVALIVGDIVTWHHSVIVDARKWWPLIIPNVLLAFCLNVTIASYIKRTSGTAFVVTGVVKDIVLVIVSQAIFKSERVTRKQYGFFVFTLAGVLAWSLMKIYPSHWLVRLLERALRQPPEPQGFSFRGWEAPSLAIVQALSRFQQRRSCAHPPGTKYLA